MMWWINCEHAEIQSFCNARTMPRLMHNNAEMLRFKLFVMHNAEMQKVADMAEIYLCYSFQCGANF